jgi:hypothetical protein
LTNDVTEFLNPHHGLTGRRPSWARSRSAGGALESMGTSRAKRPVGARGVEGDWTVEVVEHRCHGRIDRRIGSERGGDVPCVHDDVGQIHHRGRVGRERAERIGALAVECAGRSP